MIMALKDAINEMISEFCDKYMTDEVKDLCLKLSEKLPDDVILKGDSESWACGVIFAICQLNFLFEKELYPHVDRAKLCCYFNKTQQKMTLKARDIRRMFELKLGDKEFSTEFVLTMDIPEREEDLNRIRMLSEVKNQILKRKPDEDDLKNDELLEWFKTHGEDEVCYMLRNTYLIEVFFEDEDFSIYEDDGKFKQVAFTGLDKCSDIMEKYEDCDYFIWHFVSVTDYMDNENFSGVVINPGVDDIFISREMLFKVFKDYDKIDYWRIFIRR